MQLIALAVLALTGLQDKAYFDVQKLADGVYGVMRKEPVGLAVDCNVVFIVNDSDVVMVDANIGPESAKATLAALRKITKKPVRYIVATHYHDDHIGGIQTFRDAFPGLEVIGHSSMAEAMKTFGVPSRKDMIEIAPQMTAMLRDRIAQKKDLYGKAMTEETRASYESDIRLADRYAKEMPKVKSTPPNVTVDDRLILKRGDRTIEVLYLGPGHTKSDLVVNLPKERIAITGDLVVWPVPLVGGPQSFLAEWPKTLDKIRALKPALIVPGHGPVLHDDSYLETLAAMFRTVNEQVKAAVGRGEILEQAQKSVNLDGYEKAMVGDSPVRAFLFLNYVKGPSIAAAYREATAKT